MKELCKANAIIVLGLLFVGVAPSHALLVDDFQDAGASATIWNTHPDFSSPQTWSRVTFDDDYAGMGYLQDGDRDGTANSTWMMNQTTTNFKTTDLVYSVDFQLPTPEWNWGGSANFYLTPDADTKVWDTDTRLRLEMYMHEAFEPNPRWIEFGLFRNNNSSTQIVLWQGRSDLASLVTSGNISLSLFDVAGVTNYELVITQDSGAITPLQGSLTGDAGLGDASWNNGVYIGFDASTRDNPASTHGFAVDNVEVIPEPVSPVRTWATDAIGDWNDWRNWAEGAPPDANTHTAVFGGAITSARTIVTDSAVTVKSIQFDNSNTYAVAGTGSVSIESDDPGTNPSKIEVLTGDHEFQAEVALNNDAEVAVADTHELTFINTLSLGGNTLTKTGLGTMTINSILNTGGGTVVGLGGTITGSGTVGGDLTNTSATVAPGNSPGTLTVTGDFSQAAGGTLAIELAGTASGEFDVLAVTGSASLGGSLDITELYTPGGADTWTILTAGGGITGSFDAITAGYQVALANGDTELVLSLSGALLPGDANGDGCVDDLDLTALAVHWQQSTNLWEDGDFNGDGIVDDLDLTALAVNWQQGCDGGGSFSDAAAGQAIVPEPATVLLVAVGGLAAVRRRRR